MHAPLASVGDLDALVELRADVNAQDAKGQTPLHIAATEAPRRIAKRLCELGANTDCIADVAKGLGAKTPPSSPPRSREGLCLQRVAILCLLIA